MDFQEVIRTRRSIRSYAKREIPEEVFHRILEGARIAPSGNNVQPWKFVIVQNPETKKEIAGYAYEQSFIAEAPVVVVCCGEKYPNRYEPLGNNCYLVDTVIAIDHLILAARSEGVGSCWVGAFHEKPIRKLLHLPENLSIIMIVPLGYPGYAGAFGEPGGRKDWDEIAVKEES